MISLELNRIPRWSFGICMAVLIASYAVTIYAGLRNNEFYGFLLSEDGPLENMATLLTLGGGLLFGSAYIRHKHQRPYLFIALAFLMLFVFFEEISWGQRFLGLDTPDTFERINAQKELNLHNFSPIYQYVNGVVYTSLDLYLIGLPLLVAVVSGLHRLLLRFRIPIPSPAVAFLAFFNYFLFTYVFEDILLKHGNLGQGSINYGEMIETGIELSLFLFAFECFSRGLTWIEGGEDWYQESFI